jgi:hypothetical protein
VQNTTRRLAAAALSVAATVALAGCSAGTASHVVQGSAPTSTPSVPVTTTVTAITANPASSALNTQTLDQVDSELGNLDTNLAQVNSDLNSPQGDS